MRARTRPARARHAPARGQLRPAHSTGSSSKSPASQVAVLSAPAAASTPRRQVEQPSIISSGPSFPATACQPAMELPVARTPDFARSIRCPMMSSSSPARLPIASSASITTSSARLSPAAAPTPAGTPSAALTKPPPAARCSSATTAAESGRHQFPLSTSHRGRSTAPSVRPVRVLCPRPPLWLGRMDVRLLQDRRAENDRLLLGTRFRGARFSSRQPRNRQARFVTANQRQPPRRVRAHPMLAAVRRTQDQPPGAYARLVTDGIIDPLEPIPFSLRSTAAFSNRHFAVIAFPFQLPHVPPRTTPPALIASSKPDSRRQRGGLTTRSNSCRAAQRQLLTTMLPNRRSIGCSGSCAGTVIEPSSCFHLFADIVDLAFLLKWQDPLCLSQGLKTLPRMLKWQ